MTFALECFSLCTRTRHINLHTGTVGMQRLNTMVSSLVLRRTKDEVGSEVLKLTKRQVVTHTITLNPEEERVYQVLFREARSVSHSIPNSLVFKRD